MLNHLVFANYFNIPAFLAADNVSLFVVSGISLLSINVVDEIVVVVVDAVEVVMVVIVVGFEVVVVVIGFVGLKVD